MSQHTHAEFLKFLKHIYRKHPRKHLHVICDNSWLNQIEIWFHIFSRDVLKDGVWPSKKHLIGQILAYIDEYNRRRAKLFAWTYTGKPLAARYYYYLLLSAGYHTGGSGLQPWAANRQLPGTDGLWFSMPLWLIADPALGIWGVCRTRILAQKCSQTLQKPGVMAYTESRQCPRRRSCVGSGLLQ